MYNENAWASINISLKLVHNVKIENKSKLAEVLTWCWTGDKPLTETMMTQFDDACVRHPTSMSPSVQTKLDCKLSDANYFWPWLCFSGTFNIAPKFMFTKGLLWEQVIRPTSHESM